MPVLSWFLSCVSHQEKKGNWPLAANVGLLPNPGCLFWQQLADLPSPVALCNSFPRGGQDFVCANRNVLFFSNFKKVIGILLRPSRSTYACREKKKKMNCATGSTSMQSCHYRNWNNVICWGCLFRPAAECEAVTNG